MKALVNVGVVFDEHVSSDLALYFDRQIHAIAEASPARLADCDEVIDGQGLFVAPGLIDIHIHGFGGAQATTTDDEALECMSRLLPSVGVTSYLATTVSLALPHLHDVITRIHRAMGRKIGANVLGCHLEGPFINAVARGAHDAQWISELDEDFVWQHADTIKIVTLAPELRGALGFVARCRAKGIIASIGHTDSTYDETMQAVEDGATLFAHTFNAMGLWHHRRPGAIGAALDSDAYCELIADDVHVHPAAQRLLLSAKGEDKIILVSDSTMAGLDPGSYLWTGHEVIVKDNAVRFVGGGLAGGASGLNVAVRNFSTNTGLAWPRALRLVTANPARLLGLQASKGSLAPGMDADLVLLADDMSVYRTFVGGECVYRRTRNAH